MTNQEIVAAYSRIAPEYAKAFYHELDTKHIDRKLYEMFAEKLPEKAKCIELGCGPGEISVFLEKYSFNLIGIDKSKEMIEVAKSLNSNISFITDDVFDLTIKNSYADGIVAPFLIVNFDDEEIKKALVEMNRILKNQGILLITFHIGHDEEVEFNNFFVNDNKIIFKLHNVEKIQKIIKDSGFEITETIIKEPYKGEQTTRAFIFGKKT